MLTHLNDLETSYYGLINALLSTHFPAKDRFMIKPKVCSRQPPIPGGRAPIDSAGQQVGTYDDDGNPDFLVSVGSAQLHQDIPLLIYEVKRENESFIEVAQKMDRYMHWAKEYQRQVTRTPLTIWAVLVVGPESYMYVLDATSDQVASQQLAVNTTGAEIVEMLQRVRACV